MKTINLILLLIAFPLFILCQDRQTDSLALVQIYNDMGGSQWSNSEGWLTSSPLEEWNGVTIDENRVSKLRLFNVGLSGTLSSAIYNLTALTSLDLFNGTTTGTLSEEISNLAELRTLALANLELNGTVPDLDGMPVLDNIRLNGNNLSGSLPAIPYNSSLVRLSNNNFSGPIPDSWADNQLTTVDISFNNLEGSINIFSTFTKIRGLDVDGNNWDQGPLPDWLDDLPSLINFFGSEANFSGDIPDYDFSNSPNFNQIIVNSNTLTGDISNLTNGIVNPLWLDAKNNLLGGELSLDQFENVYRFNLSNNNYSTLSEPNAPMASEITLSGNAFRISTLLPHLNAFPIDSMERLLYDNQKAIFEDLDTTLMTPQIITLDAGDEYEGIMYQWIRNNQEIEGANEKNLDVDATMMSSIIGRYNCIMTHPDLIDNQGNMVEFSRGEIIIRSDFTSSVDPDHTSFKVNIYPNPSKNYIKVSHIELNNALQFQMIDSSGKVIRSGILNSPTSEIDISSLENGIYSINFKDGDQSITKKIIKQ